jgi:hypothetical protein
LPRFHVECLDTVCTAVVPVVYVHWSSAKRQRLVTGALPCIFQILTLAISHGGQRSYRQNSSVTEEAGWWLLSHLLEAFSKTSGGPHHFG